MNVTPARSSAAAKSEFSERNPYPGWTACAPVRQRGGHDRLDVEVALPRRRRPDAHGDVGLGDVARTGVGVAVDRDRADAHGAQRADDSHGDLAPVGDKDTGKHRHILKTP